jgi:hypothetical protein
MEDGEVGKIRVILLVLKSLFSTCATLFYSAHAVKNGILPLKTLCRRRISGAGSQQVRRRQNGISPTTAMPNPYLPWNCWITSSIFCTTQKMLLGVAASSQNRGSRVPEGTFSPVSISTTRRTCNHGKTRFQILPPLPRVTQHIYTLGSPRVLHPQMQKRVVGFQPFLASSISKWTAAERTPGNLSPHSTDSHPPSNLSP